MLKRTIDREREDLLEILRGLEADLFNPKSVYSSLYKLLEK
jgi:hypothetical protein